MIGLGRAYSLVFTNTAISAVQDLFYVKAAADKPCVLEAVYLSNVGGTADAGDAQEELLRVEYVRLPSTNTVGSGGSASGTGTLNPLIVNDTAASFTGRTNDTTTATTSGTARTLYADSWNIRIPYVWIPAPEHRLPTANSDAFVVRLNTAPADAVTCNGTLIIRELI